MVLLLSDSFIDFFLCHFFQGATPYKLIREVSYPFELYDENIFKERTVYHKLRTFISEASSNNEYLVDEQLEIPLSEIMPFVSDCCSSIEELKFVHIKFFILKKEQSIVYL